MKNIIIIIIIIIIKIHNKMIFNNSKTENIININYNKNAWNKKHFFRLILTLLMILIFLFL
jgi:hypothetical protein